MKRIHIPGNCRLKIVIVSVSALLLLMLSGCGKSGTEASPDPVSREEYLLDTICTVSVYGIEDESGETKDAAELSDKANSAIENAFDLCRALEDKLSRTRKESDISRINEADGEWTEVSGDTIELLKKGLKYSELSGGDFDITVGGITEQWDFHAAEGEEKLPDEKALAEAAKHVGYGNLEIAGNRVRLSDRKAKIDLGGIAKGYIGDRMTESLENAGVTSAIINLGGNVICIGGKTDSDDFVIGVEAPFSDRSEIIGKVKSRDKTMVTSGVYERKLEIDGKIYHHILDTKTGMPVETELDAVTLIADKGHSADIDALSTICLIKGADEGMKLIKEQEGVEAVFVKSGGEILTTDGAVFEK